ncbi:phosphohistidine phosphatase SixA [Aliikangiella coralliicola]|uniref:Phosphohistidine phosphatase SixA n=1 Tax=Aliikangiella coralliicola TaxID=2592383 RepID=A0A545UAN9_9GAMM|nr:phosphohistidine phosphatase SixA [Aliikangiella coralliicola]TQV86535.1 phosphohistidine phosphatase SixA [Aliikangiella coralliicola]
MLKTLWIMRHGLAESEFDTDFNRALSAVGKSQAADVAEQLIKTEVELPDNMLVSPFRRTQETAQIVHQSLAIDKPFETEDLLVHFADPHLLGDFLLAAKFEKLIVVSHMPIVARLCQYLSPDCEIYGFQTAQVVKIEFDKNGVGKVNHSYLPRV